MERLGAARIGIRAQLRSSSASSHEAKASCVALSGRGAGRRHHAGAQLQHDLFPRRGVRRDAREIERIERDRNRAALLLPRGMTREAVALEDRAIRSNRRRRSVWTWAAGEDQFTGTAAIHAARQAQINPPGEDSHDHNANSGAWDRTESGANYLIEGLSPPRAGH